MVLLSRCTKLRFCFGTLILCQAKPEFCWRARWTVSWRYATKGYNFFILTLRQRELSSHTQRKSFLLWVLPSTTINWSVFNQRRTTCSANKLQTSYTSFLATQQQCSVSKHTLSIVSANSTAWFQHASIKTILFSWHRLSLCLSSNSLNTSQLKTTAKCLL